MAEIKEEKKRIVEKQLAEIAKLSDEALYERLKTCPDNKS